MRHGFGAATLIKHNCTLVPNQFFAGMAFRTPLCRTFLIIALWSPWLIEDWVRVQTPKRSWSCTEGGGGGFLGLSPKTH